MQEIIESIKELEKLNSIEERINQLIAHIEQYMEHGDLDDAKRTESKVIPNIRMIIAHLIRLRSRMADSAYRSLIKNEVLVLKRIEQNVIDMINHPDKLKRSEHVIKRLEQVLHSIEHDEDNRKRKFPASAA